MGVFSMENGGGQARGGWINESVYLVSVGGWVCVCVGVLSVGLGPGLDSMSPARSDPGMSLNCAPTRVCRKSTSRPGYVVKVRTDPGYVVKQCPRIVMNKIFDWH